MPTSALNRLQRAIAELEAGVLARGATSKPADVIALKSEIEICIRKLDELRQKL
ncbi:hypothetical protein [Pelagibacterium halotolerans]|uniref:hypothetical protein n=1 Tax=Pelagibacterium halotolerans TaxID=531813 RepID=UPI00384FB89B